MLFLDTSALLKRYINEVGGDAVRRALRRDREWAVSALAEAEASIGLCYLVPDADTLERLQQQLRDDMGGFYVVPVDASCLRAAAEIGCQQRLRTLGAIHLAAALRLPGPVTFMTFDRRQAAGASALGLRAAGVADEGPEGTDAPRA
jgi:predicted nucleic acid-binding protein